MSCLLSFHVSPDVPFVSRLRTRLFHIPLRRTLEGTGISKEAIRITHLSIWLCKRPTQDMLILVQLSVKRKGSHECVSTSSVSVGVNTQSVRNRSLSWLLYMAFKHAKRPGFIFVTSKNKKWPSALLNRNPKTMLGGLYVVGLLDGNWSSSLTLPLSFH